MSLDALLTAEMAALEADATLLERAGRQSDADRIRRDISKIRRQHDRLGVRRAATDARSADALGNLIAALQRNLAGREEGDGERGSGI